MVKYWWDLDWYFQVFLKKKIYAFWKAKCLSKCIKLYFSQKKICVPILLKFSDLLPEIHFFYLALALCQLIFRTWYELACAYSNSSKQSAHSPSLIIVLALRPKKRCHLPIHRAPIKDSDQTAQMRRLIWAFDGHACQLKRFAGYWLSYMVYRLTPEKLIVEWRVRQQLT